MHSVQFLLQSSPSTASFVSQDKHKLALHFAAAEGHTAVVQTLLRYYPAGATIASAKGKRAVHFSARWGHITTLQALLAVAPNEVCARDGEGSTPLHDAAREGQVAMAIYLQRMSPESALCENVRNEVPLLCAVRSKSEELVRALMVPAAARHVLRQLTEDDDVEWRFVDMLLRGVDGFVVPEATTAQDDAEEMPPKSPCIDDCESLPSEDEEMSIGEKRSASTAPHNPRKRSRTIVPSFLPIHAALRVLASSHIASLAIRRSRDTLEYADPVFGRNALHWSVIYCCREDSPKEVEELVLPLITPDLARARDTHDGSLPIHLALRQGRSISCTLVQTLLKAHPPSSLALSADNLSPWELATANVSSCALGAVYHLIRADPNKVVHRYKRL